MNTQQVKREALAHIENMLGAMNALDRLWSENKDICDDLLTDNYPFNVSFDEQCTDVEEWLTFAREERMNTLTLDAIREAVRAGKIVCWTNEAYQVVEAGSLGLLVKHQSGFCSTLTDEYKMSDFYIKAPEEPRYVKAVFSIDGEGAYVGIHNPKSYWNGWAIPYFTKEEGLRFIKNSPENDECTWAYDEENDQFVYTENVYLDDPDFTPDVYPREMIDGQEVYCIGGCNLIWTAEREKVFFHKDKSGRDYSGNVSLIDIVSDPDNVEAYDEADDEEKEDTLIGWAMDAETEDEWSDNANQYTRIS